MSQEPTLSPMEEFPAGLPDNVLVVTGGVPKLFSLIPGFNREKRGGLAKIVRKEFGDANRGSDVDQLMRAFSDPDRRFRMFLRFGPVKLDAAHTRVEHLLCPDYWFLRKAEEAYGVREFDEAEMLSVCPIWPTIWANRFVNDRKLDENRRRLCLRFFGIWPALVEQLRNWENLAAEARNVVTNGTFALASLSLNPWFLMESIAIAPGMADEFKGLLSKAEQATSNSNFFRQVADTQSSDSINQSAASESASLNKLLASAGEKLVCFAREIGELPSSPEVESEVWKLIHTCESILDSVRRHVEWIVASNASEQIASSIESLTDKLRALLGDPAFEWLTADGCEEISRQWRSSIHDLGAVSEVDRALNEQMGRVRQAFSQVSNAQDAVTRAKQKAVSATSLQQRIAAGQEQVALLKQENEATSQFLSAQQDFVGAISREGVEVTPEQATSPSEPLTPDVHDANAAREGCRAPAQEICAATTPEMDEAIPETGASTAQLFEKQAVSEPQSGRTMSSSVHASSPEPAGGDQHSATAASSQQSSESANAIWSCLKSGDAAFAYQVQRAHRLYVGEDAPSCPSQPLLKAATLAREALFPDRAIAEALKQAFSEVAEDDAYLPASLILAASVARPILLCAISGAEDFVETLHLGDGLSALYELLRTIRDHSLKLRQYRLDAESLDTTRHHAEWRNRAEQFESDLKDWIVHAPKMTMKFQAATDVWREWQKPGGLVYELLSPVRRNDASAEKFVSTEVGRLKNGRELDDEIDTTYRSKHRRGESIQGTALAQLHQRVNEACSYAERWLELIESRPLQNEFRDKTLASLQREMRRIRPRLYAELSAFKLRSEPRCMEAGAFARIWIDDLYRLFEPGSKFKLVEDEIDHCLGEPLLEVPELSLQWDWTVECEPDALLSALIRHHRERVPPSDNLDSRLASEDLIGATRVVERLEARGAEGTSSLRGRLDAASRELWSSLREQLKRGEEQLETALAYGLISEADRDIALKELLKLQSVLPDLSRLSDVKRGIRRIDSMLTERRHQQRTDLDRRLSKILRSVEPDDVKVVESALDLGDFSSATEYLHRLEGGERLAGMRGLRRDAFAEFFPAIAREIDSLLEAAKPNEVIATIKAGRSFGPLSFSGVPDAQLERAAHMLETWYELKRLNPKNSVPVERLQRHLTVLVEELGFVSVTAMRREMADGDAVHFNFDCSQISDRDVCPVPFFGSIAAGRYRIVCLWDRPSIDVILNRVGTTIKGRPALVLYFGRMTERLRRTLSQEARRKRQSFLLVDETLISYLTAEPGARLGSLFACCLPFTWSDPYVTTASIVPPELFYGRRDELRKVVDPRGACFVYGGRQLGKTALLRHAERAFNDARNQHIAVWIDLKAEGIGQSRDASEIWLTIHRALVRHDIPSGPIDEPRHTVRGRVEKFAERIRAWLDEFPEARLLVLLDEADRFLELDARAGYPDTSRLKGLMEQTERRFKVVFAGLHNVLRAADQANHPLGHFGEPIEIGPLMNGGEWREATRLIRDPLEAAGFKFESDNLVDRILAQTNFYPSLIQLYCAKLLGKLLEENRFSSSQGPRYPIRATTLDETYRSRELLEEIRQKFRLTLQLDPRYAVIAYGIAHRSFSEPEVHSVGLQVQALRNIALDWWVEGFQTTSDHQFRTILDEMCGLGVLRRTPDYGYTLRNHNLLLLMGTVEEVEENLLQERDLPTEYSPHDFHPSLTGRGSLAGRHPLTAFQLSTLQRKGNSVQILCGTEAGGLTHASDAIEMTADATRLSKIKFCTDVASFERNLGDILKTAKSGDHMCLVPPDLPWTTRWIVAASHELGKLKSKDRHVTVLFFAGPDQLKDVELELLMSLTNVQWETIRPWSDGFMLQFLQDFNRPSDPADRQRIFEKTGFWPKFVETYLGKGEIGSPKEVRALLFGNWAELLRIVDVLVQMASPASTDDVAELAELDLIACRRVLVLAERLGLALREPHDMWMADRSLMPLANKGLVSLA